MVGAEFVRSIDPGELVIVENGQLRSLRPFGQTTAAPVHLRMGLFLAPRFDRRSDQSVYSVRKAIGAQLAIESPVEADLVIPVPDSGVPAAIGYAQQSGIPFELGIIRSHYVGRTFIQPGDQIRRLGVKLKHNANRALIKGKSIILVDDSIVRGTTSLKIVQMMREAGAREVHMRIASPPTTDTAASTASTRPSATKLLAVALQRRPAMTDFIHADSLAFVCIDGLYKALGEAGPQRHDAALLRRLLHRRLSDAPDRLTTRLRRRTRPRTKPRNELRLRRTTRAGHRREPGDRRRHRQGARRRRARTSS